MAKNALSSFLGLLFWVCLADILFEIMEKYGLIGDKHIFQCLNMAY